MEEPRAQVATSAAMKEPLAQAATAAMKEPRAQAVKATDNDFERTLASCCGHSISLLFNAPAKRGRFISSGPCHATASFLCFATASFLCFGQEGLHPTSSTVSLLCHSQEGLHLASTSGNFSQTPLGSGQGVAVCSLPSASGHHNPVELPSATCCVFFRLLLTRLRPSATLHWILPRPLASVFLQPLSTHCRVLLRVSASCSSHLPYRFCFGTECSAVLSMPFARAFQCLIPTSTAALPFTTM